VDAEKFKKSKFQVGPGFETTLKKASFLALCGIFSNLWSRFQRYIWQVSKISAINSVSGIFAAAKNENLTSNSSKVLPQKQTRKYVQAALSILFCSDRFSLVALDFKPSFLPVSEVKVSNTSLLFH